MKTGDYTVLGRSFRNRSDYEAALRDEERIKRLKERLKTKEDYRLLLKELQENKYRFATILGQDFREELEDQLNESENRSKQKEKKKREMLLISEQELEQKAKLELKKQERIRRLLLVCCITVALGCFGYLLVYSYQANRVDAYAERLSALKDSGTAPLDTTQETVVIHYAEEEEIVVPDVLEEYKTLYSLNQKLIGWVKVDDTYIDYPVLQTSNNEYYLDHNFDQDTDKNGSIFLDKDCDILNRSTNLILYGHHMQSGKMFGQLNKYISENFYEEHRYIQFDTIYEKGTYEIMYVFRSRIYEESEIVFKYYQFINADNQAEFDSNMKEMGELSLYNTGVTAEYGDDLLTLSTCDYYTDYGRFVVVAKRIS